MRRDFQISGVLGKSKLTHIGENDTPFYDGSVIQEGKQATVAIPIKAFNKAAEELIRIPQGCEVLVFGYIRGFSYKEKLYCELVVTEYGLKPTADEIKKEKSDEEIEF